ASLLQSRSLPRTSAPRIRGHAAAFWRQNVGGSTRHSERDAIGLGMISGPLYLCMACQPQGYLAKQNPDGVAVMATLLQFLAHRKRAVRVSGAKSAGSAREAAVGEDPSQ